MSGERWLKERREERVHDFAPPSAYYEENTTKKQSKPQIYPKHDKSSIFNKIRQIKEESMKSEKTDLNGESSKQSEQDSENLKSISVPIVTTDPNPIIQQTGLPTGTQQVASDFMQSYSGNQIQNVYTEIPQQNPYPFVPQFDSRRLPPSFPAPPPVLPTQPMQSQIFLQAPPTFQQAPPIAAFLSNQQAQQLAQAPPPPPPSYPSQSAEQPLSLTLSKTDTQTQNYSAFYPQSVSVNQVYTPGVMGNSTTSQYSAMQTVEKSVTVPKIPKENIIDRRLMQSTDSD